MQAGRGVERGEVVQGEQVLEVPYVDRADEVEVMAMDSSSITLSHLCRPFVFPSGSGLRWAKTWVGTGAGWTVWCG